MEKRNYELIYKIVMIIDQWYGKNKLRIERRESNKIVKGIIETNLILKMTYILKQRE
jgi:hypothetical protein